jgi:hypothetical protein
LDTITGIAGTAIIIVIAASSLRSSEVHAESNPIQGSLSWVHFSTAFLLAGSQLV